MRTLNSRFLVAFFFVLISVGQAHPLALAWSLREHAQCFCQSVGKDCVHGCARKKLSKKHHSHHHSHSQDHSHHESETSRYVSPNCGKATKFLLVSFHHEPFLLNQVVPSFKAKVCEEFLKTTLSGLPLGNGSMDPPPPKLV